MGGIFRAVAIAGLAVLVAACVSTPDPNLIEQVQSDEEKQVDFSGIEGVHATFVQSGQLPGVTTLVARNGSVVFAATTGHRGLNDARPLQRDAMYRLFSMTKPVTSVATLQLIEKGKINLDDPVLKYVPEFAGIKVLDNGRLRSPKRPMTIRHLLTHTSGLSHGLDPNDPVDQAFVDARMYQKKDLEAFAASLAEIPLKFDPGERWSYSTSMDVLALIVQRVSGRPFDEYLRTELFVPLGMTDTGFVVDETDKPRFLPNHFVSAGGDLKPVVEYFDGTPVPESAKTFPVFEVSFPGCGAMCDFYNVTLFAGSGGLVSTADDFMRFALMLANGGDLDGHRILRSDTVASMSQDHLRLIMANSGSDPSGDTGLPAFLGFGLGVSVMNDREASGLPGSNGTFFWTGAAGTTFWVDPEEKLAVVSMTQRLGEWPIHHAALQTAVYDALRSGTGDQVR